MKRPVFLIAALILAACSNAPQSTLPKQELQPNDPLMAVLQQKRTPAVTTHAQMPFFNQAATPVGQTGYLANPNVQAFMHYQNQVNGLNIQYLNDFFAQVGYRGNIINIMNRPSTSRPWYEFQKGNSGAAKINAGKRFYQANRTAIDQAAARYGVPAEIIVAIIGIETNYGANMGNIRTADALATLAFDYPRRGAFFQQELADFLKLAQEEGRSPFEFSGSYAGAMGMPQFMPSSFRRWAVDFDGNGRRDIWHSIPDTAASVAHYLKQHGWQTGGRMVIPVALTITPQLQAIIDDKTALNYTVGQLRQLGVQPLETVSDHEKAVLYHLEIAPNQYRYFIGLNNFYSVWHYNHSRMYVTAVRDIANGVGAGNL